MVRQEHVLDTFIATKQNSFTVDDPTRLRQ